MNDLRDLQALDAAETDGQGRSRDGAAAPGELRARQAVDLLPAAGDVQAARAGQRGDGRGTGELAAALRTIWLVVATGGWSSLSEVRAEADVDDRISVTRRLFDLKSCGYIAARLIPKERRAKAIGRGSVERFEYGVTPQCRVPFGLTAGEVTKALIGGKVAQ